jgi:hypothetical protein
MKSKARKRSTTHVRVATDLAVKLAAVARYEYANTADILDPVIRDLVDRRFAALPPDIRARALARLGEVRAAAPQGG